MNSDLRREIAQTAEKFAARHLAPAAAAIDHAAPAFPAEIFRHGVDAGFDRFVLPESAGGAGGELADLSGLIQTLARTCAGCAMVFGAQAATLHALCAGGDADGPAARLLAASLPVGVVFPEPLDADDFDAPAAAEADGAWRLTGWAGLVANAAPDGFVVVFAKGADGRPLALLLDAVDLGAQLGPPEPTLGLRAMPLREVTFADFAASPSALLATGRPATDLGRALLRDWSLVVAAAAAGAAAQACRRTYEYAAERYQGGKQIIDHSHLRSLLGRMTADAAAADGAALRAAARPDDLTAALAAKMTASDAAVRVCTDAVQLLGGYGYMRDFGVEKIMRDAAALSLLPVSNARAELLIAALEKDKRA
jgi:alkylation response protein AidB-like acyl-CoA dehydrogenase